MRKKKFSHAGLKMLSTKYFTNHAYLIYMYKQDLVLNNLKWWICHKNKPNR